MSTPDDREMVVEEEINELSDDGDYLCSDEEGEIREQYVLALPALNLTESSNMVETIREEAAIAADRVVAAAEEAEGKTNQTLSTSGGFVGSPNKIKVTRPHVLLEAGTSDSMVIESTEDKEPIKKAKKKGSTQQFTNPLQGNPKCYICGRPVFEYQGLLPQPTCHATEEGSGGTVDFSSGDGGSGLGTGLEIDLNADPVKEGGSGSGFTTKFDLNKSPKEEDI